MIKIQIKKIQQILSKYEMFRTERVMYDNKHGAEWTNFIGIDSVYWTIRTYVLIVQVII
jgi:hypothetical protein